MRLAPVAERHTWGDAVTGTPCRARAVGKHRGDRHDTGPIDAER
jgi:hypothetical protein